MTTRRGFIQQLVLTLLTLVFGPEFVAKYLTEEGLNAACDAVREFRMRGYYQLVRLRPQYGVLITW